MKNPLAGKDIIHGGQFCRNELEMIMDTADYFCKETTKVPGLDILKGWILATLFFEPSTRTRLSFETAMYRLGGSVVGFSSAESSSVSKGESLADTIRTVDQYADMITMRHPAIGSAEQAATIATHPVFNGGDGAGQHPTQALLDLYTIRKELGRVDGATIVLCGDLKNGRTVHSGVEIYRHYGCKLVLVAPPPLQMPEDITNRLQAAGISVEVMDDLRGAIEEADVLYMTRIQKERFSDAAEYEKLKSSYILTRQIVEDHNPRLVIMHPLPRVNEIETNVDDMQGAAYFRQAKNGVYVRMALLALVAGKL